MILMATEWLMIVTFLASIAVFGFMFKAVRYIVLVLLLFPLLFSTLFYVFKFETNRSAAKDRFFSNWKVGVHRGSHRNAPENTIESFIKAKEENAQLVEFDIIVTLDGIPIITHDDNTSRVADYGMIVSQTTFEDLRKLKLKRYDSEGNVYYEGQMPSLMEAVDWCTQNDMMMLFDVKTADDQLISTFVDIIKGRDLYDKVIVASFYPDVLFKMKRADPNVLTGQTWKRWLLSYKYDDGTYPSTGPWLHWFVNTADRIIDYLTRNLIVADFLGVDMILASHLDVDLNFVLEARRSNILIAAWTSNDKKEISWLRDFLKIPLLTDGDDHSDNQ